MNGSFETVPKVPDKIIEGCTKDQGFAIARVETPNSAQKPGVSQAETNTGDWPLFGNNGALGGSLGSSPATTTKAKEEITFERGGLSKSP